MSGVNGIPGSKGEKVSCLRSRVIKLHSLKHIYQHGGQLEVRESSKIVHQQKKWYHFFIVEKKFQILDCKFTFLDSVYTC